MMKKLTYIISIAALVLSTQLAVAQSAQLLDKVAAVVNDTPITQRELDEQVKLYNQQQGTTGNSIAKDVLSNMITKQLLVDYAQKANVTVTDAQVSQSVLQNAMQALPEIGKKVSTATGAERLKLQKQLLDQYYAVVLGKSGLTKSQYLTQAKDDLIIRNVLQGYLNSKIQITNQDIAQFKVRLKQNEKKGAVTEYDLQRVLIEFKAKPTPSDILDAKAKANNARTALIKGTYAGLKAKKGDAYMGSSGALVSMGWWKISGLDTDIGNAVKGLKAGQVSQPVKTDTGFMVFKVMKTRRVQDNKIADGKYVEVCKALLAQQHSTSKSALEDCQIREAIFAQRQPTVLSQFMQQLHDVAYIKTFEK